MKASNLFAVNVKDKIRMIRPLFSRTRTTTKTTLRFLRILKKDNSENLRASLCKILISTFAHKMDFAHNFSVDFV